MEIAEMNKRDFTRSLLKLSANYHRAVSQTYSAFLVQPVISGWTLNDDDTFSNEAETITERDFNAQWCIDNFVNYF